MSEEAVPVEDEPETLEIIGDFNASLRVAKSQGIRVAFDDVELVLPVVGVDDRTFMAMFVPWMSGKAPLQAGESKKLFYLYLTEQSVRELDEAVAARPGGLAGRFPLSPAEIQALLIVAVSKELSMREGKSESSAS